MKDQKTTAQTLSEIEYKLKQLKENLAQTKEKVKNITKASALLQE